MVDEESQPFAAEPVGGARVNRDQRREPGVIEGEVAGRDDGEAPPEPFDARASDAPPFRPDPPQQRSGGRLSALASGALGGLAAAALVAGVGWYYFAPRADLAQDTASRLSALEAEAQRNGAAFEAQAQRESAALAGLDKRIAALETGNSAPAVAAMDKRLGALEAQNAAAAPKIDAAAQSIQNLTTEEKDLRANVDATRADTPALTARIGKLESAAPQAAAAGPELSALSGRVDKLEAALAAPKSETRVAPEKPTASDNPAAVAIVAEALRDKLAAGAPFGAELAALESLGVDPAKLAPLKAVVNGAPTGRALAASFDAVAEKALAAATKEQDGIADRFLAHLRGLVQVRHLNETAGDDPAALVSQVQAESRRGDVGGALAAFAKLPEPARQAAAGWAAEAGARQAADAALQSIREAAIGRLAAGAKP
jgi:hypothetical protein